MILQKIRSKAGFTLIELLVVIAIIAIAASIFIPLFVSIIDGVKTEDSQVEIVDQNEESPEEPKPQKEEEQKL